MADKPYSNRELDQFFKRSDSRADELHNTLMQRMDMFESNASTILEEIKVQTTKTNGRVNKLEDNFDTVKMWRARIVGALAVLSFMLTTVLAIAGILATAGHLL